MQSILQSIPELSEEGIPYLSELQYVASENSISEETVPFIHTHIPTACPSVHWNEPLTLCVFFPFKLKNYERKVQFFGMFLYDRYTRDCGHLD